MIFFVNLNRRNNTQMTSLQQLNFTKAKNSFRVVKRFHISKQSKTIFGFSDFWELQSENGHNEQQKEDHLCW